MPTRRLPVLAFLFLYTSLILSGMAGFAQGHATDCNPEDQLTIYLKEEKVDSGVVLAFDHLVRTWSGYYWDGAQDLRPLQDDVEIKTPFTNIPRVFLTKEEVGRLKVFVVNTNPLLFSTDDNVNTVASIEELANLQKLTSLLGGFLASAVGNIGEVPSLAAGAPPSPAAAEGVLPTEEIRKMSADIADAFADEAEKEFPDRNLLSLYEAAAEIVEKLKDPADKIQAALDKLEAPRGQLEQNVQKIKEASAEIRNYVQLVESGRQDGIEPRNFDRLSDFPAEINTAFQSLANERAALTELKPLCPGTLTALRDAIRLYRIPLPVPPAEQRVARDQFRDHLETLAKLEGCPFGLDVPIAKVRDYLRKSGPSVGGSQDVEDSALRPLFRSLDAYLSLVESRKQALKTAGEVMAASGDAVKFAGAVQDFKVRRSDHLLAGNTCSLRAGVLKVNRVPGLDVKLGLTQFGKDGLKVVVSSPFQDSVVFRHSAAEASYEIQRAWRWDFDVDVATYYTEIADPTYKAVVPEGGTAKVITLTDEDSRAGELAMLLGLQWRPRKMARSLISIGPQLGVALSSDHPAIFGGIGIGIGRYIKLGFGYTRQEVKELRSGKEGVTVVEDDAAIKTRDGYATEPYFSLSITLDDLPFFKAP